MNDIIAFLQRSSYFVLLSRNRNYRSLWLGALISQMGDWFNLIASASLIEQLTGSNVALSGLFLARFLPLFLFSSVAGVFADRFSRRRILIFTDLARAVTVLGFLLVREPGDIWLLYLLTAVQFSLSAIFNPAKSAVIANIVEEEDLVTANALDSFTWSTMLALGALAGGIVADQFGIATAFLADAVTFLGAAFFVSRIRVPATLAQERASASSGGWLDFLDGLRYLRGEPFILIIGLTKAGGSLVWGAINVLEVNFAHDVFPLDGDGELTLGIIYALTGVGTGLAPLLFRRLFGDTPRRALLVIAVGFWFLGPGILALGAAPTFPLYGLATVLRTAGSGTIWVFSAAMLQMIVPDRFRGRVFAFEFAALTLTQSISVYWAGFAQDSLGWSLRAVTVGNGVAALGVAALWSAFALWALSRPALPIPERAPRGRVQEATP
ncbi:MAG: MFS transporter [Candidatus Promineifilaceae bacterium]|nr:MFS transporter [Candidatus Promineifilaceae bacterium]